MQRRRHILRPTREAHGNSGSLGPNVRFVTGRGKHGDPIDHNFDPLPLRHEHFHRVHQIQMPFLRCNAAHNSDPGHLAPNALRDKARVRNTAVYDAHAVRCNRTADGARDKPRRRDHLHTPQSQAGCGDGPRVALHQKIVAVKNNRAIEQHAHGQHPRPIHVDQIGAVSAP